MTYECLKVQVEDSVAWLEFNHPPINAFNREMLREVPRALAAIRRCVTEGIAAPYEEGLRMELAAAVHRAGTPDFAEGFEALS